MWGRANTRKPGRTLGGMSTVLFCLVLVASAACEHRWEPVRLPQGMPELHHAVAANDKAAVTRLAKVDANVRGLFGWTALHVAAIFDRPRMARELIAARAELSALDNVGMTPLHWASRRANPAVVAVLLEGGAEVMARNKFDMTPLHEASTEKVARLLLDGKAELMARDVDGFTPLHTAPNKKVAELLIDRGADINARAKDGRTPLEMPPLATPRVGASVTKP